MSGVIVHLPQGSGGAGDGEPDGEAVTLRLGPGEVARFGRGSATIPVELRLADAAISRLAGEIRVTDDHWQLTNHSATHSYLVENPEGAGEYLRVPPRRVGAPIPFEFSRVVLPSRGDVPVSFQVFAPDHVYLDPEAMGAPRDRLTVTAYSLDETATYFLVLVALCEPRLRDQSRVAVPTTPQIVERLKGHVAGGTLTARAISSHIDYLAEEKLRIGGSDRREAGKGDRRNGKREGIVGLALRFGLVREEHLTLLPPQTGAGGRERQNAR
ncbi:serine/threonine protein kinase [Streptomyces sp. NBC_00513]|uniref:serine/threonine protein kinase n=1 Tax=unclassified Streptomyces TaxID=2593676 RepID=UPI00225762AC|nr:serine/threonine protein kinase [Streptomyces sp. NBC_00424]MCX5071889.1 serine/threonine protein kinase [Streptomyces sp. NBC_00424]WUD44736.1 serine/threonine protein kinase [Streptomyces sp. NBC_00513]